MAGVKNAKKVQTSWMDVTEVTVHTESSPVLTTLLVMVAVSKPCPMKVTVAPPVRAASEVLVKPVTETALTEIAVKSRATTPVP